MAVVSISRIQIRRGRKNSGTGLPQLASGELGWAIDTQELYVGNGSVAEGAPYVGNTKLLSEHDDLFQFADSYEYKSADGYIQTGSTVNVPVRRTLQDRLDDRVSVRAFGCPGDGTNQTVALQRAIDQLYLNPANKGTAQARVELILEPGEYLISGTIYIPPFVTLRGAGSDKTIILAGSHTVFQTVNEESTVGSYASDSITTTLNQSRELNISGMSISTQNGIAFDLRNVKNSTFKDIKIEGVWELGDADDSTAPAIKLSNNGIATATCSNNEFEKIEIRNYSHAVISDDDIEKNTWKSCIFNTLYHAFVFGENTIIGNPGQATGPAYNVIEECVFDDIYNSAIIVYNGRYNLSKFNKFFEVGNAGGGPSTPRWALIRFDDTRNQSEMDWFKRTERLGYNPTYLVNYPFVPEISGPTISRVGYAQRIAVGSSSEFSKVLKLSANEAKGYLIEYIYKANGSSAYRSGRIDIVVDPVTNPALGSVSICDEYSYVGDEAFDEGLQFLAEMVDENSDGTVDTVALKVLNSTSGDLTFNITSKA